MISAQRQWEQAASSGSSALALPLWPPLWAGVLVAALGLRFAAIDLTPLAPDETARALEGLKIWRAAGVDYSAGPLLPNLIALCFVLFTATDGTARLPSALAGLAICATPLLLRTRLGSGPALVSALLLAASPVVVLASRSVDPAALAVLAEAALVVCWLRASEQADGRWLVGAALAAAAGLGTTPGFVGQLAAIALAATVYPPDSIGRRLDWRTWVPRAVGAGLAAAIVLDTLLLTRPGGLQAGLVTPFLAWFGSLRLSGATLFSAAMLTSHEILILVLAAVGLPRARRDPFGRFLLAWAVASGFLGLLGRRADLLEVAAPLVPLAWLAGLGAGQMGWLRQACSPAVRVVAIALLVPAVFLVVRVNGTVNRSSSIAMSDVIIAVGAALAIALMAGAWLDLRKLASAAGLACSIGIVLLQVSLLTRLNYAGFERAGPALLGASAHPEQRQIEERVQDWWRRDPTGPIEVDASLRPLLEWSLRDGPPVNWSSSPPKVASRSILGGQTAPNRPSGTWLRLVVAESFVVDPDALNPAALWRWLFQRQAAGFLRSEASAILVSQ